MRSDIIALSFTYRHFFSIITSCNYTQWLNKIQQMYFNKFKPKNILNISEFAEGRQRKFILNGHQRFINCKNSGRGLGEFKHHNRIVSFNVVHQTMFQDMIFLHKQGLIMSKKRLVRYILEQILKSWKHHQWSLYRPGPIQE